VGKLGPAHYGLVRLVFLVPCGATNAIVRLDMLDRCGNSDDTVVWRDWYKIL